LLANKDIISKLQNKTINTVAPFVTTRWDQGVNYNNYCPANSQGPGGHCVTGCVATAMAQAMKYYNYPINGKDSILYTGDVNIRFENTYYRWDSMTTTANSVSGNAISELIFHCGVTTYMVYGPDESGTMTELVPNALIKYFRYHPAVGYEQRKNFTDAEWDVLIRDNIELKHPVVYSGSGPYGGHAWICDGYADTCFYHFNWGWSGYANGYFYYNNIAPGSYTFNEDQGAVVNIMPYNTQYCQGSKVMTDYSRSFEDGSIHSYYWNNTNCNWLIAPDSVEYINFAFTNFETQSNADFVYVYDGGDANAPLIGKFSGNQIPNPITSTGGKLYLEFTSDSSVQGQGFSAFYDSRFCVKDNILTAPSGSINDGSGNYNYLNNSHCNWLISQPNFNAKITFKFNSLNTADSLDYVAVYDGKDASFPLLGKFWGNQIPDSVVSTTNEMLIVFESNSNTRASGWSATYHTGNVNVFENNINEQISIYPNPVNEFINIKLKNNKEFVGTILIYNIAGEIVYEDKIQLSDNAQKSVNLINLPKGYYTLKITNNSGVLIKKIIKD